MSLPPHALLFGPISAAAPGPLYEQLVAAVKREVAAGQLSGGSPLPSFRQLAADLLVSVITVKRAYLELERAGVIVTRQGKGSFVADTLDATRALAAEEFQAQLEGLLDAARKRGLSRQDLMDRIGQALSRQEETAPPPLDEPDRRTPK